MDNTQLIIKMYKNGIGIKKISTILNITILETQQCLYDNNIDWKDEKYRERDDKACSLYKKGTKITEIANTLNINRHTVTDILKRNNVYEYSNIRENIASDSKTERNNSIIYLYKKGLSMREVAKQLNVCTSTVKNVLDYYNVDKRPPHMKGHSKGTSKNRKHFFNLDSFEKIDTEAKAYWLGFLYADGYVSFRGVISLSLQEQDKNHLEKFKSFVNANDINLKYKKSSKSYSIDLCSVKMSDDLINLGCKQKKSFTLEFPTEEQVPKHLIHHFMRGYFDGDGCIYISKNKYGVCFSVLGTPKFLDKYEQYLLNGIGRNKPTKRTHESHWNDETECINYGGKQQVIKIFHYLYKDATIYLDRKFDKFNKLLPS